MKRRILTLIACLGTLGASGWLIVNPAGAFGEYKISCDGGTTLTCKGTSCTGHDDTSTSRGWCSCGTAGGTSDFKQCPARGDIRIEESDS